MVSVARKIVALRLFSIIDFGVRAGCWKLGLCDVLEDLPLNRGLQTN